MEGLNTEYRVHITIRRQGQPVHMSREFRTENVGSFEELSESMEQFVVDEIEIDNDAVASMEG